jgi:hypothetical protein
MTTIRRNLQSALFLTLSICALFALASPASAVVVGQKCTPTTGGPVTQFQRTVTSGNSYVSPIGGIVTSWGIDRTGEVSNGMAALTIGKVTGLLGWSIFATSQYSIVKGNVVTESPTRLPINAGDSIGFTHYNSAPRFCGGFAAGDIVEYDGDNVNTGDTYIGAEAVGYRSPVWATVEPDADKDGYGDESQDKCPQSAALQSPCPILTISQQLASAKGAISITGAASAESTLTATATVKVPKLGKKKSATVTFSSPPTAFAAGELKKVKLKLPSRVTSALAATKKSKKLKFTVTLTGNGLANTATSVKSISLRGTKK